jgi:hypothetical protein
MIDSQPPTEFDQFRQAPGHGLVDECARRGRVHGSTIV